MYAFKGGIVTITQTDPDAYAPNDSDLMLVKEAMQDMIKHGRADLDFTVQGLHVVVEHLWTGEVNDVAIMREALKPLTRNERIHR